MWKSGEGRRGVEGLSEGLHVDESEWRCEGQGGGSEGAELRHSPQYSSYPRSHIALGEGETSTNPTNMMLDTPANSSLHARL
jgi:hypothetical protein